MAEQYYEIAEADGMIIKIEISKEVDENKIPNGEVELKKLIEKTIEIINGLPIITTEKKTEYLKKLLPIAKLGLSVSATEGNPKKGKEDLEKLHKEIMDEEGEHIKHKHIKTLSKWTWITTGITALIAIFFWLVESEQVKIKALENFALSPYLFVFAGALVGVWIAYLAGSNKKEFIDLLDMYREKINTVSYLFLTGVCSIVLVLLLNFGIFALSKDTFSGNEIMSNLGLQILIGIISGIAGDKLVKAVTSKADTLFDEIIKTVKEEETTEDPKGEISIAEGTANSRPASTTKITTTITRTKRRINR